MAFEGRRRVTGTGSLPPEIARPASETAAAVSGALRSEMGLRRNQRQGRHAIP
jgi:hypothetical protein